MINTKNHPVFLLSTRRSGTTLLQRILNSHRKLTVWGEHGGFLKPISRSYVNFFDDPSMKNMVNQKRNFNKLIGALKEEDDSGPIFWHNSLDKEHLMECYRSFIYNLFTNELPSNIFWGFKEVRYGIDDFVLRMLNELFPEARFIYLFRSPQKMVRSAIGAWNKDDINDLNISSLKDHITNYKNLWMKQNTFLHNFYQKKFNGKVFYISYEEMLSSNELIEKMFDFLELDFNPDLLSPLERKYDSGQDNTKMVHVKKILDEVNFSKEMLLFDEIKSFSGNNYSRGKFDL